MRAKIEQTVKVEYFDAPPPSGAFRFTLLRKDDEFWVPQGTSDCSVEFPQTEFEIGASGKYKVVCQRLNIIDQRIGPVAESNVVFVNGGEYQAPLVITLGIATDDEDENPDGIPF